jgi:hypothetical protein
MRRVWAGAALVMAGCTFDPLGADVQVVDAAGPVDQAMLPPDAAAADAAPPCPAGWVLGGARCYKVQPQALAWNAAETACVDEGGTLAVIGDDAENELVRGLAGSPDPWWLGASDVTAEGTFVWVDGSALGYTAWEAFQPDNLFDEDCLEQGGDGLWNDAACENEQASVCERAGAAD